jgi:hypothetical protein
LSFDQSTFARLAVEAVDAADAVPWRLRVDRRFELAWRARAGERPRVPILDRGSAWAIIDPEGRSIIDALDVAERTSKGRLRRIRRGWETVEPNEACGLRV